MVAISSALTSARPTIDRKAPNGSEMRLGG